MRETRIYDSGDGWLHKVELWHGASETFIMSDTRKEDDIFRPLRKWKPYKKEVEKESWLSAELERANKNGHLK